MIYDLARTERLHLAILAEKPPVVLRPKLCACGKTTTAKQLHQYKRCVACVRSAP